MADNRKIWAWIFWILYAIGMVYMLWNYNIEDLSRGLVVLVILVFIYGTVRSSLSYKKGIENFKENVLLNAKEKWDFLYQDIWVPIAMLILIIYLSFVPFNNDLIFTSFGFPILLLIALFEKLILRNKLIVTNNEIAFSKRGDFFEIKFRLVKGMIFDEDERRVTINYEKIIKPKYNFLSTKSKTLDIDEIEETVNENKAFSKNGIFDKDWDNLKMILEQKSKEFDFGLSVIYPI